MKKLGLFIACLFAVTTTWAFTPVTVTNADFELCTQNYFDGFDGLSGVGYDIPNWHDVTPLTNGGDIDGGCQDANSWWGAYSGYSVFCRSSATDPGFYQITEHTVNTGQVFKVGFQAKGWGDGIADAKWTATIFAGDSITNYEIIGTFDTPLLPKSNTGGDAGYTYYESGEIMVTNAALIGKKVGLQFKSTGVNNTFANIDEISLSVQNGYSPFFFGAEFPVADAANDVVLSSEVYDFTAVFDSATFYLDSLTNTAISASVSSSGGTNTVTADTPLTLAPSSTHTAFIIAQGSMGELQTNSWDFTMADRFAFSYSPVGFGLDYNYTPTIQATVINVTDDADTVSLYTNGVFAAYAAGVSDTTTASVVSSPLAPGQVVSNMVIVTSFAYDDLTNSWAFTMGGDTGVTVWNTDAPPIGAYDVAQTNGAASPNDNIGYNADQTIRHEWTYISDSDRPAQGQTFTVPSGAGYVVDSVWLRNPAYEDGTTTIQTADGTYTVRITNPALTNTPSFVKATETLTQLNAGAANEGRWVQFKLANPVVLNGGQVYGFDVGSAGGQYWNTDGLGTGTYAGGSAYRSGDNGDGNNLAELNATGDRAFVVQLSVAGDPFNIDVVSPTLGGIMNPVELSVDFTELVSGELDSGNCTLLLDGGVESGGSITGSNPYNISYSVLDFFEPLSTHTGTVVIAANSLESLTNTWTFTMADAFVFSGQTPTGTVLTNNVELSVDVVDAVSSFIDATMYLDDSDVGASITHNGSTSTVSLASTGVLSYGEHTVEVVVDGTFGPATNSWVFSVHEETDDQVWNINIAGNAGGSFFGVSDGIIAVAPASLTGSNLWNNVVGVNNAGNNATNAFVCTDNNGLNPIGFKTYGSQFYGTRSTAEDNIQQEMFGGWVGANAPMNMTGVISNLDTTASYDIYLYSTWHWTENDVTYDIVQGFGSDVGEKICSETRATVAGAAYDDYSACVEGENYVVFRDVTPTVDGIIAFTGVCPDGVLSGLQIREYPGQGVLPVANVISATPTGTLTTNATVLDVTMVDYNGSVDTNNVILLLDGSAVTPDSISQSSTTTTVSYATGVIDAGLHTAGIVAAPGQNTNEWTFALSYEMSIPTSLAHHWDFEDGAGTTVADIVGGANGTIMGASNAWTTVGSDGALSLLGGGSSSAWNNTNNAVAGSYVDLPNGIMSNFTGAATIEAVFVSDRLAGENWQRVYTFGASNGGEDISDSGAGQIFLTPSNGGILRLDYSGGAVFDTTPAVVGDITHVVVVLDPDGYISKCYVNGVLINTVNGAIAPLSDLNDINNWFGRSQWPDSMFRGKLLDIRMYTGLMTASEAAARYAEVAPDTGPETGPAVSVTIPAGGPVTIIWPDDGYSYSVLTNADLTNPAGWGELATTPYADGGNSVVTNDIGSELSLFYKLQYNP